MITPNKEVKLMDFGAAEMLTVSTAAASEGRIFGTLAYMSPEQISGLPLDVRSDFFSLGTILYEMFTARKAFPAEGLHELIEQVKSGKYQPVRRLRRSISPMTEELLEKLLAVKPSHRPNDAAEIEEDLKVCTQFYAVYGTGARIHVPFSWRKYVPVFSMAISILALVVSIIALLSGGITRPTLLNAPVSAESQVILQKAELLVQGGNIRAAIDEYQKVPEGTQQYIEAQARAATLYYRNFKQLTTARAILEALRTRGNDDPYVNALLGQIYYQMALYAEARQRLEASIESNETPVVEISADFKDDIRYFLSLSWDKEYTHINKDAKILENAVKSWGYYLDISCESGKNLKSKRCQNALKRKESLAKGLE